ncbi:aldose epimerase [Mucilaginibacter sp. PPCGB 2223]|uniref:aldose 1-epimerase family protein n=1 Tax=Mucilaginibacter sp. PPCGB 2223 TaxID=1886027 RepID=UPI000824B08A|nr:aldose 1-epimerase family protein [Mucilaginibacter sp. PPCGB 2223]OCX53989.1 aldose epimerase [Mucilaginibacter sp. PPCGB 2223]
MPNLQNQYLKVSISQEGAQLTSFYDKTDKTEHLWQADASVWPWHAPNLFPIVGGVKDNQIHVDGNDYMLERHGFARNSHFQLVEASDTHAKFSLLYNEKTLAVYPYKFEFQILYDLIDNALRICYKVINQDAKTIYFSVGGHPAFNVPFHNDEAYEDYYLEFEQSEKLEKHLLGPSGLFTGETEPVKTDGKKLKLTKDLFAADALVFKNIKSREVHIKSSKHNKVLSVEYPHFNYLGVWAKPGAPFVCIEPWLGCADNEGEVKDFKKKEAIQKVDKGHVFEAEYFITTSY